MAGIVFGCIVPHPPILIPEIGGIQVQQVAATTRAMEQLTAMLAQVQPETIFLISPHGPAHYDAMGTLTTASSKGNFRVWGARGLDYSFNNDQEAVATLQEEAKNLSVPLRPIGEKGYELDHGVLVPIYFLSQGMKSVPLIPLTFSWLPLSVHYTFGQAIQRVAARLRKRVVVVASGDLSHRLLPGAPAGYDPLGKVFDERLRQALASYDTQAILNLDPELTERAGECGLRSIVILLGALEGLSVKPQILSYEGPFGVGYLVAAFEVGQTQAEERK
ncbi:MAG: AmmeMemoRadiSam system protein B [Chloroflexi bacterium]|nr:AmmeMemoRadiSam system protein B [Chloroflexota bacterium]